MHIFEKTEHRLIRTLKQVLHYTFKPEGHWEKGLWYRRVKVCLKFYLIPWDLVYVAQTSAMEGVLPIRKIVSNVRLISMLIHHNLDQGGFWQMTPACQHLQPPSWLVLFLDLVLQSRYRQTFSHKEWDGYYTRGMGHSFSWNYPALLLPRESRLRQSTNEWMGLRSCKTSLQTQKIEFYIISQCCKIFFFFWLFSTLLK